MNISSYSDPRSVGNWCSHNLDHSLDRRWAAAAECSFHCECARRVISVAAHACCLCIGCKNRLVWNRGCHLYFLLHREYIITDNSRVNYTFGPIGHGPVYFSVPTFEVLVLFGNNSHHSWSHLQTDNTCNAHCR